MRFCRNRSLFFKYKRIPNFLSSMLTANRHNLHRIHHHPFNHQLFKGTLSPAVFGRYLRDDYFYLQRFSSVLQKLASNTININPGLAHHLDYMAKDIVHSELNMQLSYKEHLMNISDHKPGRSISLYAEYLAKTVKYSAPPVALSAVWPCFGIYHKLGGMHKNSVHFNTNPYKQWIATYSSPDFITATQHLAKTLNTLGKQSTPQVQSQMKETFKIAVQFELDFFDEVFGIGQNSMRKDSCYSVHELSARHFKLK